MVISHKGGASEIYNQQTCTVNTRIKLFKKKQPFWKDDKNRGLKKADISKDGQPVVS